MTTNSPSPVSTRRAVTPLRIVGSVLAILLGLVDLVSTVLFWADTPVEISIAIGLLGLLTVVGGVVAILGKTWGVWVAAVTRFLSIPTVVPVVLMFPGVPEGTAGPAWVQLGATVLAIVLLLVALRRRRA
ncbi:MAG: hypothetical protein ABI435_03675 [Pseudolysinimonas sp.]